METFDDTELREMLMLYEVCEPSPDLVNRTKHLMYQETVKLAQAPSPQASWLLMLVGFSVMMSLSIFYMLAVGTVLSMTLPSTLPSYMVDFLRHSMYAFTAAGGSLVAGLLMVFCLKQFQIRNAVHFENAFVTAGIVK